MDQAYDHLQRPRRESGCGTARVSHLKVLTQFEMLFGCAYLVQGSTIIHGLACALKRLRARARVDDVCVCERMHACLCDFTSIQNI